MGNNVQSTKKSFWGLGSQIAKTRAQLMVVSAFVVGVSLGGVSGYMAAAPIVEAAENVTADDEDEFLRELRRLAVAAPLDELVEKRLLLLRSLGVDYRREEDLWRGLERLADAVLARREFPDRIITARLIVQTIRHAEPEFAARYAALSSTLSSLQ